MTRILSWAIALSASVLIAMAMASISACSNDSSHSPPKPVEASLGWSIGPTINGINYSPGSSPTLTGDSFPLGPNTHVHYVTRPTGPLSSASEITLTYRLDLPQGASVLPSTNPLPGAPALITLYFQRSGDDWSGVGPFETYRWWATFATQPLEPGEHTVSAKMAGNWSAVMNSDRSKNPAAFEDAMAHAARVGFTLGGGTGYGHGVFATAPATFTILKFEVN